MSAECKENDRRADAERDAVVDALAGIRRYLDDGIVGLGGYSVAGGVIGKDRSDLRKAVAAIDGEGGTRVLSLEDLLKLLRRIAQSNRSLAVKIAGELVGAIDLLVFPKVTLSTETQNERMKGAFAALGPMGLAAMEAALDPNIR